MPHSRQIVPIASAALPALFAATEGVRKSAPKFFAAQIPLPARVMRL
jgi:hypothetical protein